jgi:serine/threonine-protein kinase
VNERAGGIEAAELTAYSFETGQSEMVLHVPFGQVAPTGHLVYVTVDGVLTAAPFNEKRMKVTGPPVSLASNVFLNDDFTSFALSGNGTLLYGEMQPRQSRLAWVDRSGVATGIDESRPQEFTSFALSADGRRVAAEIIRDGVPALWVYAFPRGLWTRLGSAASNVVARRDRPAWDPSGTRITFIAPGTSGLVTAWSIPVDGQGPPREMRRVTSIPIQDGEFSADGQWFVFRQGPVGPRQRDILYARPDPDSAAYELAVTDADEFAPTLSPDGRWLAYVSDAPGREEIVVQSFPGPGRRTQVSFGGGFEPRWAHSGRELFYRDGAGNLVAVEVRAGADVSIGARRILFSATGYLNDRNATLYEVAADDQRFLFIQPVSGGDVSWKLVRGFLSELRAEVRK